MPTQDIEINDVGKVGVITDTPGSQVVPEAWTTGTNARVVDGGAEKLLGWAQIFGTIPVTNDSFTKIEHHYNGADASTTILDTNAGGSPHTWTANGNAQLDTADFKFGGSSLLLDGTGDFVDTPDHTDFTLGTSDFTIECFFKCNVATGTERCLAGQVNNAAAAATESFVLYRMTTGVIQGRVRGLAGAATAVVTGTTIFSDSVNTGWHHVAFVRLGGVLRLFIDGTQEGGDANVSFAITDSANRFAVGRFGETAGLDWLGWIDEFRLSVGIARYGTDPILGTGWNDINTKSLLRFNGNDAATTPITDEGLGATTTHTWTAVGNAQLDTAIKKNGVSALLCDGTGDWVETPDQNDFTLGSADFTIDFWFNCAAAGGTQLRICGQQDSVDTTANCSFRIFRNTGNLISAFVTTGAASAVTLTGTTQFTNSINPGWHHYALVRTGGFLRLFLDGIQESGDLTITGTVNNSANKLAVGASGEVTIETWNGSIDDFRLSNTARWSSGFVPTINDSFVKAFLQFNGTDGSTTITDSNAGGSAHTWTANGNAQLDTAITKRGGASLLCDGVGDSVSTPDHADFTLGTGNFTIDCWFNCVEAAGTNRNIAGQTDAGDTAAGSAWRITRDNTTNTIVLKLSNGSAYTTVTGTTQFTNLLNTGWHHVAAVRTGDVLKLFLDGIQEGGDVTFNGSVLDSSQALHVGNRETGGSSWNGSIDDFRLSVGIARWTANFVPTTANFTPPTISSSFAVTTGEFLAAAEVAPHFAIPVRTASTTFWVYTSLTKAFVFDGTTHTEITRQTADYATVDTAQWNGTLLADVPIVNNGVDIPQYWPTISVATRLANLPNWPSTLRAKVVRAFGPFLMALGITKSGIPFPHTIKWSHPADPGSVPASWDETDPTRDAGETPLPDVDAGILVDMLPLGDTMYIYKENSVRKARFVGGRDIFDFGKSAWLEKTGILAPRCVTITGDGTKQVFASQDDILWHDGNRVRSVLSGRRRRELFNLMDTNNYTNSFMFTNPLFGEVWFCFPPSGQVQPTRAFVMNYMSGEDVWPLFDVDGITFRNASIGPIQGASDEQWNQGTDTWADDTGPWSSLARRRVVLCGTDARKFYNLDSGSTRDGVVFTATLQRIGLSVLGKKRNGEWIVDFDRWKMWDTIW